MKKLVQKTGLPKHGELYELHRLLGALLSQDLTIDQKLDIIGNEYDIPIEDNLRKDVSDMCNLHHILHFSHYYNIT